MISRAKETILNLLFPTRGVCLNCGDPSGLEREWLCEACRARLKPGLHRAFSHDWPKDGISGARFALYYERPASRLVRRFKYDGVYGLVPFLAECLAPVLEDIDPADYDCIVPVPLHEKRLRERGFNQAELLAREIALRINLPLRPELRRTRNTAQQAKLSINLRQSNLKDAFMSVASFEGLRVLLVDDVLTTGSTANSCARALRRAGAVDVQVVALAGSRWYRRRSARKYRKKVAKTPTNV